MADSRGTSLRPGGPDEFFAGDKSEVFAGDRLQFFAGGCSEFFTRAGKSGNRIFNLQMTLPKQVCLRYF
ncbi:MAG: hypothetical protein AB9888_03640 [Bacteroidales bacterium]